MIIVRAKNSFTNEVWEIDSNHFRDLDYCNDEDLMILCTACRILRQLGADADMVEVLAK